MTVSLTADLGRSTATEIAGRVGQLYSLPAIANKVIELTSDPHVDNRELKECIERDPALTVRVLRVVNSSLFGLSGNVDDLNQALALLGVKPLKMLVLGFTLPEALFLDVAREQLDWYWRSTLARAVAAREIAEQLFDCPGDEAFLAGLLQDIGVLALMGQIGRPYAEVVGHVIDERLSLQEFEDELLGFNHSDLTARLLEAWNMPSLLAQAIDEPKASRRLAHSTEEHAPLARTLHLAELLAQLVGQCRLSVLPELLEAGGAYCNLNKESLDTLVRSLDPKVRQLAEVLSLPVEPERDYLDTLTAAHRRLADMTEGLIGERGIAASYGAVDKECRASQFSGLRTAVTEYLATPTTALSPHVETTTSSPASLPLRAGGAPLDLARDPASASYGEDVQRRLVLAAGMARANRESLSVALVAAKCDDAGDASHKAAANQLLSAATRRVLGDDAQMFRLADAELLWILSGKERSEAVALANSAINQVRVAAGRLKDAGKLEACVFAAGVASVDMPTKNFPPQSLMDAAHRCLSAALSSGGAVKSLVVS